MDFFERLEIVAICTQKNHFFDGHTFKADIGQHFDKSEKNPPGRRHHPKTAEIFFKCK